jgi:hypothetical protein
MTFVYVVRCVVERVRRDGAVGGGCNGGERSARTVRDRHTGGQYDALVWRRWRRGPGEREWSYEREWEWRWERNLHVGERRASFECELFAHACVIRRRVCPGSLERGRSLLGVETVSGARIGSPGAAAAAAASDQQHQ